MGTALTRTPGEQVARVPAPAPRPTAALDRYIDFVAAHRLAGLLAGEDHAEVREELLKDAEAVAVELAGPHPSAVEALLSRTISLDLLATRVFAALDEDRRVDRAHKRLLSAVRLLETVRRRAVPAVMIGQVVGQQQVNLGGPPAPPGPSLPGPPPARMPAQEC